MELKFKNEKKNRTPKKKPVLKLIRQAFLFILKNILRCKHPGTV